MRLHSGCLDLNQLVARAGSGKCVVRASPLAFDLNSVLRCPGSKTKVARAEWTAVLFAFARLGLVFSLLIGEYLHVDGRFLEGGGVGGAIGMASGECVDWFVDGVE